jgi:hypothetical protein
MFNASSCHTLLRRWRAEAHQDAPTILPMPPLPPPLPVWNRAELVRLIRAELRNPETRKLFLEAIAPELGEVIAEVVVEVVRRQKGVGHAG